MEEKPKTLHEANAALNAANEIRAEDLVKLEQLEKENVQASDKLKAAEEKLEAKSADLKAAEELLKEQETRLEALNAKLDEVSASVDKFKAEQKSVEAKASEILASLGVPPVNNVETEATQKPLKKSSNRKSFGML